MDSCYSPTSVPLQWSCSVVSDSANPWTIARQAPPSMGFSRQEYWNGLPFPSPGDLSDPGIEPRSPALQADALTSEPQGSHTYIYTRTHMYFSIYFIVHISICLYMHLCKVCKIYIRIYIICIICKYITILSISTCVFCVDFLDYSM